MNVTAAIVASTEPIDWDIDRVSSWNRLLRRTAWIMRFSNRCRKRIRDPGLGFTEKIQIKDYNKDKSKRKPPKTITIARLSGEELAEAELRIYRQLQKEKYPKAFETLQLGLPVHPKEKIASLLPVWDERDKLIRVTGRVALALRDRNVEPPILLPANHRIVSLIISDRHCSLYHAGVKTTLSELKERFWIVKGRQQTRKVWFACVTCQKLSSPPFQELAAPLPLNRLKKAEAFNITGVDFAGPLYFKPVASKKTRRQAASSEPSTEEAPTKEDDDPRITTHHCKCYVCLFTCAVTRAVHLELVPDLSARSFLLAFRRFAARRGPVSVMYSDNAQTFRCVSRHLNILQADPSVQDLLARRNLLWIFSASLAPWWGGFWERMVRSVKDLLRRSNGRACLAYDELEASLIEIESVINARPLNYIGEGADDPLPITPNQFLNNRRSTCATPEPAVNLLAPTSTSAMLVELDKERREYVSHICSRFIEDYVMQLDNFQTKGKPGQKIRVGEVVLIHDENTKRLMWSTGLVLELRKSRDGLVRSVVLRSPNGNIINRAIQCLYPLEVRNDKKPEGRDVDEPAVNPVPVQPAEPTIDPAPAGPVETIADPALIVPELPDPVAAEVEPNGTGSGGEHVGNLPTRTTRSGRKSRPPQHLANYCLRGPR